MRTARISDSGKERQTEELAPYSQVTSFHMCDSVGCTIVTIERPSPDRLSAGPLYICALHVHSRSCPPESFMLYRGDNPIQDRSTKNRPVFGLSSSFGEPQALKVKPAKLLETIS